MKLLVSGATASLRRLPAPDRLGVLLVPHAGNRLDAALLPGLPWAVDNAAFSGFDPAAFCGLLARVAGRPGCRFVACPDVVGDAGETARLFDVWQPVLRALGLPVALVGQDGAEDLDHPWDRLDALFVGGSTDWKVGPGAAALVREAKRRGLWVHMGRVNTRKRFRHAFHLGCDSVDGSGFSRWPDQRIPLALGWLAELDGRPDGACAAARVGSYFQAETEKAPLTRAAGWSVTSVGADAGGFVVRAAPDGEPRGCPRCGATGRPPLRHGTRTTTVRDSPRAGRPVRVVVRYRRYRCRSCGRVFGQPIPGVSATGRSTDRALCYARAERRTRNPEEVAGRVGVSARTLRRWLRPLDPPTTAGVGGRSASVAAAPGVVGPAGIDARAGMRSRRPRRGTAQGGGGGRSRDSTRRPTAPHHSGGTTMDEVDLLVVALKARRPEERWRAAKKLGPLGAAAEKAVPALLDALGDKDGDVRHFAGEALGALGKVAAKAVPGLTRDLLSGVPATRNRAAHAVKKIGPPAVKAVPALISGLAEQDTEFRRLAALALAGVGRGADKAVPALTPLLADADPDVRWTAAHALGAIGPKAAKAVPALTKALRDENADVREGARVAIDQVQAAAG